jgi:hypothetical protein
MKINGKRLMYRSFYYLQIGASLAVFPFTLLTFITLVYENLTFLKTFFPNFATFALSTIGIVAVFLGILGYGYKKKSMFFKAQRNVDVEADPYCTILVVPREIPFWEAQVELLEKHEVDCTQIKRILLRSGSKKFRDT